MISVGGAAVVSGTIVLPSSGVWRARLDLDQPVTLSGQVSIKDGLGSAYTGTVLPGAGVMGSRGKARIVGGSAGLREDQAAQHFQATTVGQVFNAILSKAGEAPDPFIFPTTLVKTLGFWSTTNSTGGANLEILASRNDLIWRVRPSGVVWIGPEAESLKSPAAVEVIDGDPSTGFYFVALEGLWLQPGMVQSFGKVDRVEYEIGDHLRAKVWVDVQN